jgi:hypothetical protein
MDAIQYWELASYVVTVFGLPLAIFVFLYEQRRERENEDEEIYDDLSDSYKDFLKLVLANPDLRLRSQHGTRTLSDEQRERMLVIFDMLIALFERAYLLAYEDDMSEKKLRRWRSWEDYMREWCRRSDFVAALPGLLRGEDPDFAAYILRIVEEEAPERAVGPDPAQGSGGGRDSPSAAAGGAAKAVARAPAGG